MNIKKIVASIVFVSASFVAVPSYAAGICGIGKVTEVREGFNNTEDLIVRLDTYDYIDPNYSATIVSNRWIRFKAASLTPDRLQSIRAIAYLALVSGKSVYAYTANNDFSSSDVGCGDATELSVFNEGVEPRFPSQINI